jgi:hypothetical protein
MINCVIGIFVWFVSVFLPYFIHDKMQRKQIVNQTKTDPFFVSEYYDQMEKAVLDILENQETVDQTIILWWGLDGLRLNEDGTMKWVSRRKPKPVQENIFFQSCQSIIPTPKYNMCQSTQAQIDALMAQNMQLQVQAWRAEQNRQTINALQSYVVQWPGNYTRLTDCCCNQTRDRF